MLGGSLLAGCTGVIPEAARQGIDRNLAFAVLRADPEALRGHRVLLGGKILKVTAGVQESETEVAQYPLLWDDSPDLGAPPGGRFLLRYAGFLDPVLAGRAVTAVGVVEGAGERGAGEVPDRYPVIRADYLFVGPRCEAACNSKRAGRHG